MQQYPGTQRRPGDRVSDCSCTPLKYFRFKISLQGQGVLRSQSEDQQLAPKNQSWRFGVLHPYDDLYTLRNEELATVGGFQLNFDHNSLRIFLLKPERRICFQVLHITWHCWKISTSFPRKDEHSNSSTTSGMLHSPPSAAQMLSWPQQNMTCISPSPWQ